jgi:hypothetical protein
MTRRYLVALCAVAVTFVGTGCSGADQSAQPAPSAGQSVGGPAADEALPHSGAPKVTNPLPASVLEGGPCTALDAGQVARALGAAVAGRPVQDPTGPSCDWSNHETGGMIGVGFVTETHQGLSGPYENTKPKAVVWRELPPIQGFPAVAYVTPSGGAPDLFCAVSVGIADDLSFDASGFVSRERRGKVDPCDAVAQLADLVVTSLRRKAGA